MIGLPGIKFGACLSTFARCSDRYCQTGYGEGATTLEQLLDCAREVEDLQGIELECNRHVFAPDLPRIKQMVHDRGLEVCMVTTDLWTQAKWGLGSLSAQNKQTRQDAIDEVKRSMDMAAELGAHYVNVWSGQDGYDYLFQSHYQNAWQWMVDGLRICAQHRNDVSIVVEYKPKEPRTHIGIGNVGKAVLLLNEVHCENTGVLLDTGHAAQAYENPAESVALLSRWNRLAYLHFNDNWHEWDDDMLVGSVHTIELFETIYWLKKVKYSGWLTLDLYPYRENGVRAARESIAWIKGVWARIDQIGIEQFDALLEQGDPTMISALMRQIILQ